MHKSNPSIGSPSEFNIEQARVEPARGVKFKIGNWNLKDSSRLTLRHVTINKSADKPAQLSSALIVPIYKQNTDYSMTQFNHTKQTTVWRRDDESS